MSNSRKKRIKYIVSLIPVLTMMIVIFLFSAKTAVQSNGSSSGIAIRVLAIYESIFGYIKNEDYLATLEVVNHVIRKGAHITEYAILAVLMAIHLFTIRVKKRDFLLGNIGICVLYAMSDEFHQRFVEGRSGQISDVGIDSIGIIAATLLFYVSTRKHFHGNK